MRRMMKEKEFLFQLSRINADYLYLSNSLKDDLDWHEIVGQLALSRLSGLAFFHLNMLSNKEKAAIPRNVLFTINRIYEAQKLRTLSMQVYQKEVSNLLQQNLIKHVFLKGAILGNVMFPIGTRSSNDIDILISTQNISCVEKLLNENGYTQGDFDIKTRSIVPLSRREKIFRRMNWGEVAPCRKIADLPALDYITIDINFSFDWLPSGTEEVVNELLDSSIEYIIDEQFSLISLDKESFLMHLCMHLYKECVLLSMVKQKQDFALYKYADIYNYILMNGIDYGKLYKLIERYELQKGCYLAFYFTLQLFSDLEGNEQLINFLKKIKPSNTEYLDIVIDPPTGRRFKWDIPLIDRVFMHNRRNYLIEIK